VAVGDIRQKPETPASSGLQELADVQAELIDQAAADLKKVA